ncbi:MAG: YggT family protein [Acidimicrobiia bacterium]
MVNEREVNVSSDDGSVMPNNAVPREVNPTVSGRSLLVQIIYLVLSIVSALLVIRFVLSLLGANKNNDFASFIYNVSNPFVRPFYGLFGQDFVYGNGAGRFEYETVVALIVYVIVAVILAKIASLGKRNVQA